MSNKIRRISCAVIVRRRKAILLQLKIRYNQWEFPGGKLDGVETALECARRELDEETGLKMKEGKIIGYVDHGEKFGCVVVEAVRVEGLAGLMEPDKQSAMGWFETLPDNMTDASIKILENYDILT